MRARGLVICAGPRAICLICLICGGRRMIARIEGSGFRRLGSLLCPISIRRGRPPWHLAPETRRTRPARDSCECARPHAPPTSLVLVPARHRPSARAPAAAGHACDDGDMPYPRARMGEAISQQVLPLGKRIGLPTDHPLSIGNRMRFHVHWQMVAILQRPYQLLPFLPFSHFRP